MEHIEKLFIGYRGRKAITEPTKAGKKYGIVLSFIIFWILFLGNTIYWMAYFPGGFNLDAYGQWMQVKGDLPLNNWHPAFVTGIYWGLTRIRDSLAFCIFVQLILFSISLAYLLYIIGRTTRKWHAVFMTAIMISINPAICLNNVCLTKDVYFTIEIIWTIIILLRIYLEDGECLRGRFLLILVIISVVQVLTRHNAVLYVLPMLISVGIIWKNKAKSLIVVVTTVLVSSIVIEGPIYSLLNIDPHYNPSGEVIGVPMSIMANALVEDPEHIPKDVEAFLLNIADYEMWKTQYITGEWDSIKWDIETDLLENVQLSDITCKAVKTIYKCPRASIHSLMWNTRIIWQVIGKAEWNTDVYIEDNIYGIREQPNKTCLRIVESIISISESFLGSTVVWNLGGYLLAFLWLIYFYCKGNKKKGIFIIPLFTYTLFTTCLLSGPNYRYFYYIPVLFIPISLIITKMHVRNNDYRRESKNGFS